MAYPLLSPGVDVTFTDESYYSSAGEGTIPIIFFGTQSYKPSPTGSGIAPGTLPENANKWYRVSSQRELIQTFGNPNFITRDGSVVQGSELNEYGLHAAYSYLGLANGAYVVRADLDYAQLQSTTVEPRRSAANNTVWFDTSENPWGISEWTGTQWIERDLFALYSEDDLDQAGTETVIGHKPPLSTIGTDLAFAVVALSNEDMIIAYQKIDGDWLAIGSTAWVTAKTNGSVIPTLIYNYYAPSLRPNDSALHVGDIFIKNDLIKTVGGVNTAIGDANWKLKVYNSTTAIWNEINVPLYASTQEPLLTQTINSTFVSHSPTVATFTFKTYDGDNWVNVTRDTGIYAPTRSPEEGTMWFNGENLVVDLLVNDGTDWVKYNTLPDYTNTDPNGVIILGSMPETQSDNTPLVNGDIWLNSSDTENYPKMYRYQTGQWISIDVANNLNPVTGIAFGEVDEVNPQLYAVGMKLFNLSESTNVVKQYNNGVWEVVSGYQLNGVPYFGRKAQRQMVVRALTASVNSNTDIRSETIYFNLIGVPGYPELMDEMIQLNADKNNIAFCVGDTPIRLEANATAIQTYATNAAGGNTEEGISASSEYLGVYYPWGYSTNIDGTNVVVPPSTLALRTIAYSDSVSYQWYAPAGLARGKVTNADAVGYLNSEGEFVTVTLSQGLKDVLYTNKINPIVFEIGTGMVLMGQKTRYTASSALDRINVVRLLNYINYNLNKTVKPFLFEPNIMATRDSAQTTVERFLSNLVTLNGVSDFAVQCDESNNTPERVDRNEMWIDVAISPVRAIEMIYVPIRIVNSGTL